MPRIRIVVFLTLALCLVSVSWCLDDEDDEYVLRLNDGVVQGGEMTSEYGTTFVAYRGIPFAEPPVGHLRFKPPVPVSPWEGILDATKDGPPCPQLHMFTAEYMGSEDCLYLNVYLPKRHKKRDTALDVIFHIHGGGFTFGEGSSNWYGPKRFHIDDFILVSFTYRVGVFGFLSTNDAVSPGNYGLLDQLEALRWVHNNIHHFGGDPRRVTLFGESAGGASVTYHMLSPLSQGLFHRAISMSGTAMCNWAFQRNPVHWAKKLGANFECSTKNSKEMVECLREKNAQDLVEKGTTTIANTLAITFAPVVDDFFLMDAPANLLKQNKIDRDIPLLIGTTKDEGLCFYARRSNSPEDYTDDELMNVSKLTVDIRPNVEPAAKKVKDKYFSSLPSYKEDIVQPHVSEVLTDGMFHKSILFTAKTLVEAGVQAYFYFYDYLAPFSGSVLLGSKLRGVCHADDLYMLFNGPFFPVKSFDKVSAKVRDHLQEILTNFAKYGKPIPRGERHKECEWPQAQSSKMFVYHINENCSLDSYAEDKDELYAFWTKEIPDTLAKIPIEDKF